MQFKNVKEAADFYSSLGWYPIPLRPKTKACRDKAWRTEIYDGTDFDLADNIGLRFVNEKDERAKKLIGIDVDWAELGSVVWEFLPPSEAVWGRDSKPISHVLYLAKFEKSHTFQDLHLASAKDEATRKKAMIVEIRVDHQSMCPPSLHPDGERLRWLGDKIEAPDADAKELRRACQLLATCGLVSRYYQAPGARHDWHLALCGSLRAVGLTEEEVSRVSVNAGKIAGEEKLGDRAQEIRTTFARDEGDPVTGLTRLSELMGEEVGKHFADSLRKIWSERGPFRLDEKGKRVVQNDQENIRRALEKLEIKLHEDQFSHTHIYKNGTTGAEPRRLTDDVIDDMWLEIETKFKFRPSTDYFHTVLRKMARENPVHPVKDYLLSLTWDKVPRLDGWLAVYGGAKDEEYVRAVGSIVLIAAVRRVLSPGCKFDELLVLESGQGQNKSTALRTLCPRPDWFSDDLPLGVDSKLVIERTSGKWIVEAAELSGMRRSQVEHLKSFLSRQVDGPVRLAYDRTSREISRQFVIVGTTNSNNYLSDPTGNRRFWPVPVRVFNVGKLAEDRDQLWAEAVAREAAGESIRLEQRLWGVAASRQEARRTEDPWEEPLVKAISGLPQDTDRQRVSMEDIWKLLEIPATHRDLRAADRVSSVMQKHNFRKISIKRDGVVGWGWGRDLVDGIWRPAGWGRS